MIKLTGTVIWLVMFSLSCIKLSAQQPEFLSVEGKIINQETNEAVAFASIGVQGYPIGTSSNVEGYFSLRVPKEVITNNFSIKITCIGYENVIVNDVQNFLEIKLPESKTMLKEVLIFDNELSAERIVTRAFKRIRKNYNTKAFISQNFYRHYCKDDSVYGRLIEAAVDIYKRKGYKIQQPYPGWKEEVNVKQLRRSFDNTKVNSGHLPIALYSIMSTDIVSYQAKGVSHLDLLMLRYDISRLRKNLKQYSFTLDGITEYDGEKVYKIKYGIKGDSSLSTAGNFFHNQHTGMLYISTDNYAIVKAAQHRYSMFEETEQFMLYRKYNDKYYPYHSMKSARSFYQQQNFSHTFHIDLITTNILTRNFKPFKGKEPGKEQLLKIDYDSLFWNSYTILKATPLEESIVADLEKEQSLKNQFGDYVTTERQRVFGGQEDEEKFNKLLEACRNNKPVFIDFWASECTPCLKDMESSQKLMAKYGNKVAFIYISLDDDLEAWRKALKKHALHSPLAHHFRIGSLADAVNLFDIAEIPRYVLVDKQGNFVDLDAKASDEQELTSELERLLEETIEK